MNSSTTKSVVNAVGVDRVTHSDVGEVKGGSKKGYLKVPKSAFEANDGVASAATVKKKEQKVKVSQRHH